MTDLTDLTLAESRAALARKEFTAVELADAHLSAIERARALNAFVVETPDKARVMAKAADARIARGEARPLEFDSSGNLVDMLVPAGEVVATH